jgi:type I restriction enzyme R subunit
VEIVPGELAAKYADYAQVVLVQRLRDALGRLNPQLPAEVIDDTFRKLTHPERPTLEARKRPMHQGVFST